MARDPGAFGSGPAVPARSAESAPAVTVSETAGPLTTAELAAFLARLPTLDTAVPDGERVDQLALLEGIKNACAGAQASVAVAFDSSQREVQAAAGVPARDRGRGVAAQVALARGESPSRGSRHLGLAKALVHEMPHTMRHLTAGRVSEWRVTIVCRETACLSAEDRASRRRSSLRRPAHPGRPSGRGPGQGPRGPSRRIGRGQARRPCPSRPPGLASAGARHDDLPDRLAAR